MGEGPDVLLIHGLGATKSSFFDTAAALSRRYRVHALDLPGFGGSSKPPLAPYDAPASPGPCVGVMDELGIERAHVVGNSMGGRVALEVGLRHPERVGGLGAAVSRGRLRPPRAGTRSCASLRPELGLLPHRSAAAASRRQFWSLFADRDLVDPSVADIVVDEFQRIYRIAGARLAFLTSARNIYLEKPFGRGGFYPRLAELAAAGACSSGAPTTS